MPTFIYSELALSVVDEWWWVLSLFMLILFCFSILKPSLLLLFELFCAVFIFFLYTWSWLAALYAIVYFLGIGLMVSFEYLSSNFSLCFSSVLNRELISPFYQILSSWLSVSSPILTKLSNFPLSSIKLLFVDFFLGLLLKFGTLSANLTWAVFGDKSEL